MYIYLKNNEDLKKVQKKDGSPFIWGDERVWDIESNPHILGDILTFQTLHKGLKDIFLKATNIEFPNYKIHRQYGIYHYGNAKAELTVGQDSRYCLSIETDHFDGLTDMKTLRENLWAGTIVPTVSYEQPQRKLHLLSVLREILKTRKLSSIQRFVLALRLSKN